MTETLAYVYSFESTQREMSNEYQLDRVLMGAWYDRDFSYSLNIHQTKRAPASKTDVLVSRLIIVYP